MRSIGDVVGRGYREIMAMRRESKEAEYSTEIKSQAVSLSVFLFAAVAYVRPCPPSALAPVAAKLT